MNPYEICPSTDCPICHAPEETLTACGKCGYDSVCLAHGCTNPACDNPLFKTYAEWVTLCKRTDDPKLAWIEAHLALKGIPSRRGIPSFHADATLEVPEQFETQAWDFLATPAPARFRRWYKTLDDMPDDHRLFTDPMDVISIIRNA